MFIATVKLDILTWEFVGLDSALEHQVDNDAPKRNEKSLTKIEKAENKWKSDSRVYI